MCFQLRLCDFEEHDWNQLTWLCGGGDVLRVQSYGKISDPIFSYMKRIIDSGVPWTVAVSFQDKIFYSCVPLKSCYFTGKPKLHSLRFFPKCLQECSFKHIHLCMFLIILCHLTWCLTKNEIINELRRVFMQIQSCSLHLFLSTLLRWWWGEFVETCSVKLVILFANTCKRLQMWSEALWSQEE